MLSHEKIIISAGGSVSGNLVNSFGIKIISRTVFYDDCDIQQAFEIKSDTPLEEVNAKVTYLSSSKNERYLKNIIGRNHNIYHGDMVSILIAGVKESTVLELVSSSSFKCDRLTTSKTKAASETLYVKTRIPDKYLNEFCDLRNKMKKECSNLGLSLEELNEFNLETKALSLVIHGNIYDTYLYTIKKLKEDYEYELQQVCRTIKELLEKETIIKVYRKENGIE